MRISCTETYIQLTFSDVCVVSTKEENVGSGCLVLDDQHSMVVPIGRQNKGTVAGKANDPVSSEGYLLNIPV